MRKTCGMFVIVSALSATAEAAPLTYVRWFDAATPSLGESISPTSQEVHLSSVDLRADYGSLGLAVDGAEAGGTARFRDEWTVTDGSGQIEVFWSLDGSIVLHAPSSACTSCTIDSASVTLRSMFGTTSVTETGTLVHTVTQSTPGSQTVNLSGSLLFSYTSGQPFGAGFGLSGGLGDDFYGGGISFFNSAEITAIVLSEGASLRTASGTTYNVVTEAPEPGVMILTAPLVLLLCRRRQRR